jgi:hypothetical protein
MELSASKIPRIEVVDALRGFAVMAIILVHNLEHFIFPVYPTEQPAWLAVLNDGVFNVIFSLFAGKAYAIFALLFGFTFYIQCHNQTKKGKDFGYRFLWRLVLLLGFATLNAAFFPAGDVLLLFAVVGLVLFLVRKWSDKAILITAIILLIQPIEWYHYIMSLLNPAHALPDLGVGAMYSEVAEYTKAVLSGKPNFHISFIMNVSPECDCWNHNDAAIVPDLGIAASFDPVALDKACADMVIKAPIQETGNRLSDAPHHEHLEGCDKFHLMHPDTNWQAGLEHAEKIGLGTQKYELITV